MQIDLEPKNHSHLYELRPMSRWLFIPAVFMLGMSVWLNGPTRFETWALVVFGGMFFSLIPMVFPRQLLSRPKD